MGHAFVESFRQGMREHGYIEGKNIHVDYRSAEGAADRLPGIAADFIRQKVDLIVAGGGTASALAAAKATSTVPIVFPVSADPVRSGVVRSLKEVLPKVARVAVLADPSVGVYREQLSMTRKAAAELGIEVFIFDVRSADDFAAAFDAAVTSNADALMSLTSPFFGWHTNRILDLTSQKRLLALWDSRMYADAGGLLSYGADVAYLYRMSARYVDKVLKGAKPGDLPVEQATKFELVVNLKTARAQGIVIPPAVLGRADHVIQ
jgi:putative ABC transport system substrate-binding protein